MAVNSKLYAIGGQAVSNVECYNPEQDAWNFVAPLPNPLAEFSACECKGKIYVIGGYTTRGEGVAVSCFRINCSGLAGAGLGRRSYVAECDFMYQVLYSSLS